MEQFDAICPAKDFIWELIRTSYGYMIMWVQKELNPLSGVDSVVSLKVINGDLLLFHHLEGLSVLLDDV